MNTNRSRYDTIVSESVKTLLLWELIWFSSKGLDGKTPAEKCGIEVNGDNKWITLIQNASRN